MKNLKRACIAILLFVIAVTSACKKEADVVTQTSSINALFKTEKAPVQHFSVNAGASQQIIGNKGVVVKFQPNSFKRRNGAILTSGVVNIQLTEMLSVKDMVMSNATTTSNGQLLQSGGQILLKAFYQGEELLVNKAEPISVSFPTAIGASPMMLFYGAPEALPGSAVTDTIIDWDPVDSTTVTPTVDSSSTGGTIVFYSFTVDSFTYINCDYFYGSGTLTPFEAEVPDTTYNDSNTAVFLIFPSINSVTRIYNYTSTDPNVFMTGPGYQIPVGITVKVAAISDRGGGVFHSSIQTVTVTAGMRVNLVFSPTTVADFRSAL